MTLFQEISTRIQSKPESVREIADKIGVCHATLYKALRSEEDFGRLQIRIVEKIVNFLGGELCSK